MSYGTLILKDSADIVWPLDDISDLSTSSKPINFLYKNPNIFSASINTQYTDLATSPMIFGGGTLLSFTSSAVGMSIPALGRFSELYNSKDSSLSFWFQTDKYYTTEYPIFKKRNFNNIGLFLKDNYFIFRYGTSSSYVQVSSDIIYPYDPIHIYVGKNDSGIYLGLNGKIYTQSLNGITLDKDTSHTTNDYLDFYGPPSDKWFIDSPAIFPNILNSDILIRHYVYGVGKNVRDDVFSSRGGNLYNFSTIDTKKIKSIHYDYPIEWTKKPNPLRSTGIELNNLLLDNTGIQPRKMTSPNLYSYDNKITTTDNSIKFMSGNNITEYSYIDIKNFYTNQGNSNRPFFVKVKLDGKLPGKYLSQRIMAYGERPAKEIITFDLYNNNGNYQIVVSTIGNTASLAFNIHSISASPDIYIGMKYSTFSQFYYAESGQNIESKVLESESLDDCGPDALTGNFSSPEGKKIRIGCALNEINYGSVDNGLFEPFYQSYIKQFYGTFKEFFIGRQDIDLTGSFTNLEQYNKYIYHSYFDTTKNKFNIKSYGYGNFTLHSIELAKYISDGEIKIGSNRISIGYPDISSSSQVLFYATLMNYSGSVVYPKTLLSSENYLSFLNNTNLYNTYLDFDFEIYAKDVIDAPPKIKYFHFETYEPQINNKIQLQDDSGLKYYINNSSSYFLPEEKATPSIYFNKNSGIKLYKNIAEFNEKFLAKPLDPRTLTDLKSWVDARFINGLDNKNNIDDSRVTIIKDLSFMNNGYSQNVSASAPIFRIQSKNNLKINQSNGGENNDLTNISTSACTLESSIDGAISGQSGFKLTPTNNGNNSYINILNNTASITVYPSQKYLLTGTIKLLSPQTSSALHANSRTISIYLDNGSGLVFTASSNAATNQAGTYTLTSSFTTLSSTISAEARLYNGSSLPEDIVFWDNIALYPITQSASYSTWTPELYSDDRSALLFNGKNMLLQSSASLQSPFTLYIVARGFGKDDTFIQSNGNKVFYSQSSSYVVKLSSSQVYGLVNDDYNVFTIANSGTATEFYVNNVLIDTKNTGSAILTNLSIGGTLYGNISSFVAYDSYHDTNTKLEVFDWLNKSFDIS